jgi:hypothetical protein
VDGGEQAFAPTGRILRGGLFLRQRDLYLVNLGADRTSRRCAGASPKKHAIPFNRDSVSLRNRIDRGAKVSLRWSWNLLLLPGRLSETRCARDELKSEVRSQRSEVGVQKTT